MSCKRRLSRGGRSSERGSALLIVFLFAAVVAIMLYREMPVAVFESQRQKEQMLIDRGAQYKRGVKLFYRKFGMYPASIEQLENTNRLRFLRHRFKDPFTGKDDWRLLHMGPGGMLVDSKVNPLKNNQLANASGFGASSGLGATSAATDSSGFGANSNPVAASPGAARSTANSGFGSKSSFGSNSGFGSKSSFGSNTSSFDSSGFGSNKNANANSGFSSFNSGFSSFGGASSDQGGVVVQGVPKRPPAVAANGGGSAARTTPGSASDPTGLRQPGQPAQAAQSGDSAQTGLPPDPSQVAQPNPGGTDQLGQAQPGQLQQPQNSPPQNNGQGGSDQMSPAAGTQGANSMNAIRRMLTNPNSQEQTSGATRVRVMSGGLAGVASKARGESIKVVNDQVDYSLWEFYYDPTKDMKQGLPGGAGFGGAPGPGRNTVSPGLNNANALPPSSPPAVLPAPVSSPGPANQNAPAPGTGAANPGSPPPTGVIPAPNDIPTTTDTPAPDGSQTPNDTAPPEDTPPQ
jgi:hypothetical protein